MSLDEKKVYGDQEYGLSISLNMKTITIKVFDFRKVTVSIHYCKIDRRFRGSVAAHLPPVSMRSASFRICFCVVRAVPGNEAKLHGRCGLSHLSRVSR